MKINVNEIQRFCTHDGPGIRTTVFLNGCPLSCKWCHNPESKIVGNRIFFTENRCIGCKACVYLPCKSHILSENGRIFDRKNCDGCGKCAEICPSNALENTVKVLDTDEVLKEVLKDRNFYGELGGVSLSGGEPMFQYEAALDLLKKCGEHGINTAVETCGFFSGNLLEDLSSAADILLWDIKDTDENRHLENTGVPLEPIVKNLFAADKLGVRIRLRCILINGINTDGEHLRKLSEIAEKLKNLDGVDFIPYHPYGESKYERLGLEDKFDNKKYIPTNEQIKMFEDNFS